MAFSDGGVVVVSAGNDVSPAIVVRDLGTRVHLLPFMDVITNPSGRFAFVDMVGRTSDTSRSGRECCVNRQGIVD